MIDDDCHRFILFFLSGSLSVHPNLYTCMLVVHSAVVLIGPLRMIDISMFRHIDPYVQQLRRAEMRASCHHVPFPSLHGCFAVALTSRA